MSVDATSSCVKPGIELVLWDFDGTLAYTSGDVWGSLCYAAERICCRFVDGFEDDDVNLSLPMERIYASLVPRPDPSGLESFDQDVTRHYRTISTHPRTLLFPGMRELLGTLRSRGVRSLIVTNKPQGALERLLDLKGWSQLFDGWVCADMGEGGDLTKAQMIRRALDGSGVDARRSVMVGDSWGDVAGAHETGVVSIAVTYGDGNVERLLSEGPEHVADDVQQLGTILLGSL